MNVKKIDMEWSMEGSLLWIHISKRGAPFYKMHPVLLVKSWFARFIYQTEIVILPFIIIIKLDDPVCYLTVKTLGI